MGDYYSSKAVQQPFGEQEWTKPERIFEEIIRHNVLITEMDDAVTEQRRKKGPLRTTWVLEYRRDREVGQALLDFYREMEGPLHRFDWYHPYDEPGVDDPRSVRFDDDMSVENFMGTYGDGQSMTIRLIELRDGDT